jgi:aspartate-semialdehyde dehydrogenase
MPAESIVLVGSETLLGREVREVFATTELGERLQLMVGALDIPATEDEPTAILTTIGDEPTVISRLNPDSLEDAAVVILAGSAKSSEEALGAKPSGLIIDLTYVTEDDPSARVRAPYLFRDFADGEEEAVNDGPQVSAHPAAIAIAVVLRRLHAAYPIARALVHVFEPASERGTPGIEELQQQTVSLLSFKPVPKKVFDTQVAYAMLPQLGEDAEVSLPAIEERIERHLASLLERLDGVPMPSLRLIQAPVFHGTSFSFWIEFEDAPTTSEIEDVMNSEPFDLRTAGVEPPNTVGVAGHSGISIGSIAPDRNSASAFWFWGAIDNLRLAAENAALIAAEVV